MFVFFVTDENEIVSDVESDDNEDQCEWKLIDDDGNVEQPKKSMTFDSIEELKSYYRRFGKQMGFGVVQKKVTRDKISRKEVGLYYLKSCSQFCKIYGHVSYWKGRWDKWNGRNESYDIFCCFGIYLCCIDK
jgi:hypothetical protein